MAKKTNPTKAVLDQFCRHHGGNLLMCVEGLSAYRLSHAMKTDLCKDHHRRKDFDGHDAASMTIEVDHEYMTARIVIDDEMWCEHYEQGMYDNILMAFCHELAHVFTSEFFDRMNHKYKKDERYYYERLTERVGRIILSMYQGYMDKHGIDPATGTELPTPKKRRKTKKKNGKKSK